MILNEPLWEWQKEPSRWSFSAGMMYAVYKKKIHVQYTFNNILSTPNMKYINFGRTVISGFHVFN